MAWWFFPLLLKQQAEINSMQKLFIVAWEIDSRLATFCADGKTFFSQCKTIFGFLRFYQNNFFMFRQSNRYSELQDTF